MDLRFDGEAKFTEYWLLTPLSATWRSDMNDLVQKELGGSKSSTASVLLIPPLKAKISNLMDDSFLKWLYVLFHSLDPFIVDLRTNVPLKDLIVMARNLSYVLTVVHHSTHKIIPKSLKNIKRPSNDNVKEVLVDIHKIPEEAVAITFRILRRV